MPNSGQGRLIVEVFKSHPRTHARTHAHYVRGRAPLNELSACRSGRYLNSTQSTQGQTSMTSAGFETAIPAVELL